MGISLLWQPAMNVISIIMFYLICCGKIKFLLFFSYWLTIKAFSGRTVLVRSRVFWHVTNVVNVRYTLCIDYTIEQSTLIVQILYKYSEYCTNIVNINFIIYTGFFKTKLLLSVMDSTALKNQVSVVNLRTKECQKVHRYSVMTNSQFTWKKKVTRVTGSSSECFIYHGLWLVLCCENRKVSLWMVGTCSSGCSFVCCSIKHFKNISAGDRCDYKAPLIPLELPEKGLSKVFQINLVLVLEWMNTHIYIVPIRQSPLRC